MLIFTIMVTIKVTIGIGQKRIDYKLIRIIRYDTYLVKITDS